MHSYLPSESELSFLVRLGIFVVLPVVVLLGARYYFGKTGATVVVLAGLGVVLAGLGLVGAVMLARTHVPVSVYANAPLPIAEPTPALPISPPLNNAKSTLPSPPSSGIKHIIGSNAPISVTELPGWVKSPPHEGTLGAGYCKYVITSQLYATPEEAEAELNKQLAVDVQQSFTVGNSPAVGWSPTADDLQVSGLVTEEVIETVPMKVGEFDTSVQRISWLVEFKPASQLALLSRWQIDEAQRRSKLILSALAAASGVMGVSAFMLRRKQTPPTTSAAQMA